MKVNQSEKYQRMAQKVQQRVGHDKAKIVSGWQSLLKGLLLKMNDYLADTEIGYPAVPDQLKLQFESGSPWNLEDGPIAEDPELLKGVHDRLLGSIFTISTHLIEQGVVSIKDLELGICTALAWPKGPFAMMNALGMEESSRLVALTVESGEFKMPTTFAGGIPSPWEL